MMISNAPALRLYRVKRKCLENTEKILKGLHARHSLLVLTIKSINSQNK